MDWARARLGGLASLLLLGLLFDPATSAAQQRTGVVLDFSGWRSGQARRAVVRAIATQADLQPQAEVQQAAAGMGADLSDPTGMARVAEQRGLDFLVRGEVRGRGGRARTMIHIHDASGNEVAFREAPSPLGRRRLNLISRATVEAWEQAASAIAEREAEEQRRAEEEERRREQEELARLAAEQTGEDDEDDDDDEEGEGALPRLVAMVGIDGRTRKASVDLDPSGGRDYDAGLFPSLTLTLESFPLGTSDSAIRGLYARFDFGVSLGLKSQEEDAMGNLGPELSTTAYQLGIHLGYLYPFEGDAARIGALVGFGVDSFSIDENTTMPSSKYTFLRVGLAADARLYENLLRARADFGYRITFGVGDLSPAFGEDGSASGFDVGIGLYGALDMGLSYGLRFGFTRYSIDFSGVGMGSPAAATATDMTDRSLNVGLQLGYAL